MYNESGDEAAGGSGSGQQQQQPGAGDPQRQGYTNQRINDELADAPFLDDLMDGGAPGAEDVVMEDVQKTPEASNSPKTTQKSPEVRSPEPEKPSEAQKSPEPVEEAPESAKIVVDEEESDDDEPLAPTQLGTALDSLMMHWCQLLTNVTVKAPVPPPSTLDHVKEVAEVCSKHFRDASVDVNNELTRLGVQWEMEETTAQSAVEEANLEEAIERQGILLQQATDIMRTRVEAYEKECPNAGKLLNT